MIPDPATRPWLTSAEVADLLGEPVSSVWRMARTGSAPVEPLRIGGRAIRWPTAPLLRALGIEVGDG